MGRRDATSTGANNEPMTFIRRFGDEKTEAPPPPPPSAGGGGSSGSREESRSRRRRDSRSRSRSRSRDRERRRRKRSRSRSPHSRDRDRGSPARVKHEVKREAPSPPPASSSSFGAGRPVPLMSLNPSMPVPISEVAKTLPPQIRGHVVAQSLLAKPEALPQVIDQAVSSVGAGPLALIGADGTRERKKKSRWSTTKQFVPGMVTILPSNLNDEQQKAYLLQLEIEEATRKLRLGDFVPPDGVERSPSPEPVYDANGKRLNTRDVRKRQELEQLRHEKIQQLLKLNPMYKPPADYRAPNIRLHDKVYIPQETHPEINFVGLLIGPRGNTLKALEAETQAKIIIRGKGSVKEGKLGRRDGPMPGENEPLHAYVTGADRDVIKNACTRIQEIINAALLIPDGQNELRKLQLRELAVLNGTLRPEDIVNAVRCSNCGSDQHKTWECPDAPNVTANIICSICGAAGHIARDCKQRGNEEYSEDNGVAMDDEYSALMAELGEKPSQSKATQGVAQFGTVRPQGLQSLMGIDTGAEDLDANGQGGYRSVRGRGGRGGYSRFGAYPDPYAQDGGHGDIQSAAAAWASQWQQMGGAAAAAGGDYGNGYEMSAADMAAYYQAAGYQMDPAQGWIAPPPLPPEMPAAPEAEEFNLLAPPPPPPPAS